MKELHIIMKNPAGNDPLDIHTGSQCHLLAFASVGYKFLLEDGKWRGDYILMDKNCDERTAKACIELVTNLAFASEAEIRQEGLCGSEQIQHVESTPEIMGYEK